jgi:Flp pilus assembly protein RcpC/CpaB
MRRWILRILLALATFSLGVTTFNVLHSSPPHLSLPDLEERSCSKRLHVMAGPMQAVYPTAVTILFADDPTRLPRVYPGATVDVLQPISTRYSNRKKKPKIVLQNVKVLSEEFAEVTAIDVVHRFETVTLQVTPEQAKILAFAQCEGDLQLLVHRQPANK